MPYNAEVWTPYRLVPPLQKHVQILLENLRPLALKFLMGDANIIPYKLKRTLGDGCPAATLFGSKYLDMSCDSKYQRSSLLENNVDPNASTRTYKMDVLFTISTPQIASENNLQLTN